MRTFWLILTLFGVLLLFVWLKIDRSTGIVQEELYQLGQDLDTISCELKGHLRDYGSYPSNDIGVKAFWLKPPKTVHTQYFSQALQNFNKDTKGNPLSISRHNSSWPLSCFLPFHEGLEDPFGVPLGYENRKGSNGLKFKTSPLNEVIGQGKGSWILDTAASLGKNIHWWRKVDEDVYIYSLAGRAKWQRLMAATKTRLIGLFVIGLITLILAYKWQKSPKVVQVDSKAQQAQGYLRTVNWIMGSLLVVTGLVAIPDFRTCYRVLIWGRHHDPLSAKTYVEMVEGFEKRGVLKAETAAKLKKAANLDEFEKRRELRRNLTP